ncbi:MAG: septal ring lytic transglycosylase RlpA family protein [Oleiphilaceae bacterium]|nr:septal ring lytic transglycosylase RlpA family protein [Oleiphilaceae bacterium]
MRRVALPLLILSLLAGCASPPPPDERRSDSRYTQDQDSAGDRDFDPATVVVPQPRYEPPSRGGNASPYTVWGESYEVMDSAVGYRQQGIASWYGAKFHGHRTSNGEIYDMYSLSAAHRSLPLPTYVRVTNLDNGKSTIVRVNDRGPFHGDRLIDLSFAAAHVLGFQGQGTARVEVEAVATEPDNERFDPAAPEVVPDTVSQAEPHSRERQSGLQDRQSLFIQVGAFGRLEAAESLREQLQSLVEAPVGVFTSADGAVHRVRVGPLESMALAEEERSRILDARMGQALILRRPTENPGNE